MAAAEDAGPRYVPTGSCNWCGHKPHSDACSKTIRTGKAESAPCPCTRRTEGTAT